MVQVKFPALAIPAFKMTRGQLLNVNLLGIGLVIPPVDIVFWERVELTKEFIILDTDRVASDISKGMTGAINGAVEGALRTLFGDPDEFIKAHPELKQYLPKKEEGAEGAV